MRVVAHLEYLLEGGGTSQMIRGATEKKAELERRTIPVTPSVNPPLREDLVGDWELMPNETPSRAHNEEGRKAAQDSEDSGREGGQIGRGRRT